MSAESVALIPECAECDARWLPADEKRWRAYLGGDDLEEPAELAFYFPEWLSASSDAKRRGSLRGGLVGGAGA